MPTKRIIRAALIAVFSAIMYHAIAADFLSGSGSPASGLGSDGDHYLRTDTSQLYKKAAGAWSVVAQRLANKGDKGDRGESGLRGPAGANGPAGPGLRVFSNASTRAAAAPQFTGQLVLQNDNNTLWRGTAPTVNAWTIVPVQGSTGPTGPTGAKGDGFVILDCTSGCTDTMTAPHCTIARNEDFSLDHVITFPDGSTNTSFTRQASVWFVTSSAHILIQKDDL